MIALVHVALALRWSAEMAARDVNSSTWYRSRQCIFRRQLCPLCEVRSVRIVWVRLGRITLNEHKAGMLRLAVQSLQSCVTMERAAAQRVAR